MSFAEVTPHKVQDILSAYLPLYRKRVPYYQAYMLESIGSLWQGHPERLLDIGGGTGVIAEALARFAPVGRVETIDVVDRFCPGLTVSATRYDGKTIPFEDGDFNAATLNNVLHHVPKQARADLLREIRRVVDGPLYIKDHLTTGPLDDLRLHILDALGNIPFQGMVEARYLDAAEWHELAQQSGWAIAATAEVKPYRSGLFAWLFPNRLETTMRFEPVRG